MITITRHAENPILKPKGENYWEAIATFNGSIVKSDGIYHLVYRALSRPIPNVGSNMNLSSVGYASSSDGIHFRDRRQLIKPEQVWEMYGCEDPRITKFGDKYFIFYTALSKFPFSPEGIKVGVATTRDFQTIEKHPVTPFNAKAMTLFPEKIKGNMVALLTANTDKPPAKIALADFNDEKEMWSNEYWQRWYKTLNDHVLPLQRSANDHIEVGAPPIKTDYGWLIIYCYIRNYLSPYRVFGIEAVLLDLVNPSIIVGRVTNPLIMPETDYELYGNVPNTIFPTGAIIEGEELYIYYGATDTTLCLASVDLQMLMKELLLYSRIKTKINKIITLKPKRFKDNPIISPKTSHPWESKATFNPAAIYENNKVYLLYRAMGRDDISTLGYASSSDGFHIDERLDEPVYKPRENFEVSGCEDPRITKFGDRFYMCYTAYSVGHPPRVALTSIAIDDFLQKYWNWEKPILISPPGFSDKDACLFPEKIGGKYAFFHRIDPCIWIDFADNLEFNKKRFLRGNILLEPRTDKWDSLKIGIASVPIKTKEGWLLIYHGLSKRDKKYRLGAVLLHPDHPDHILSRLDHPILEPEAIYPYETTGLRPDTVFSNGTITIGNTLYIYYGAADETVCVAIIYIDIIIDELKK